MRYKNYKYVDVKIFRNGIILNSAGSPIIAKDRPIRIINDELHGVAYKGKIYPLIGDGAMIDIGLKSYNKNDCTNYLRTHNKYSSKAFSKPESNNEQNNTIKSYFIKLTGKMRSTNLKK